ncbi:MAG: DUF3298 and DUF4163 domain-containing protein [Phycisphaerales bacterium]
MRTRTSIWLIVAAIVLLLMSVAAWIVLPHQSEHWETPDPKSPDAALVERVLVIERRSGLRIAGHGRSQTFTAKIPQLKSHSPLAKQMFDLLSAELRERMEDRDDQVTWSDVWEAMKEPTGLDEWKRDYSFEVVTDDPKLVSMLGTWYDYSGGTHGMYGPWICNYAMADNIATKLKLADLFTADREWFSVLTKGVERDLRRQKAGFTNPSVPFTSNDFGACTISRAGLRIHFAPYVIGSFAEGIYTATVPWAKLRAYMKADSVVTRWVDEQAEASRPPESVSPR